MNMRNKSIIILSGLILSYYFYSQYHKAKNLMFKIVGNVKPDFKSIPVYEFKKLPVNINVELTNPTEFEISVNTINLKFYLNNQELGSAIKSDKFKIGALGKTYVPIIILIDLANVGINISTLIQYFTNPDKSQTYQIRGFVDSSLGRLVLAENYSL